MTTKLYTVQGMDCAHCAEELEEGIAKLDGVSAVQVDFVSATMRLEGDTPFDALQARARAFGKTLVAPDADPAGAAHESPAQTRARGGVIGFWDYLLARRETQLALGGGALVVLTFVLTLLGLPERFSAILYTVGLVITAYPIARSAFNGLRINHEFNINALMTIAAIGALVIGEYLEAATVIFLFAVGEALEGYTADRARDSIRSLMALKPLRATRLAGDREEDVPVEALALDDHILVKPGEQIAMDGVVLTGASGVNQAPITGESVPVAKDAGDEVFAGTINGEGALTVRVTRLVADNTLSRIVRMVEEAQSVRAPSQRLIDRIAHYYTPIVALLALLIAVTPPLLLGAPFYDTPSEQGWLYRALSLLVIACPCALVISTPVTVISALAAAARRGVLIKGGAHLEALATVKAFAFDKTGTLTQGKPTVTAYRSVDCPTGEPCERCDDVLALAAAVERRTTHPLAQAVVQAAELRALADAYAPAETVELLAGRGVQGTVGGERITVGSHTLFDAEFPHAGDLCAQVRANETAGQTTMLLAQGERVRGYVALADEARANSAAVITALESLGMSTIMLTGDNAAVAEAVGAQVGVDQVRAGLLPQDKVEAVRELMTSYQRVAMVGDGVNDTPALAAATVGIAMGGAGSPQALETADIALMADDLTQLPFAVRLARFARSLILQNVVLSFGIKLAFLALALVGATSLWAAIFADVGVSLLVTLNGMRPLRLRATE